MLLQMVLHLNKKYLPELQIQRTCIQNRLFCTLNRGKNRLFNVKRKKNFDAKVFVTQTYFLYCKNRFYLIWYRQLKTTFKKPLKSIFQMEYRLKSMFIHRVGRAGSIPSPLYSIVLILYRGSSYL